MRKQENDGDNNEEIDVLESQLDNLYVGQEIIIVIKDIKYEQNDLFITATFHSVVDDNKIE